MKLSSDFDANIAHFHKVLDVATNFDIVYHTLEIAGRKACIYFVDGFTKDEILLRLMQSFASIKPEDMPQKIPSSWQRRLAIARASSSETQNISSG